jgi:hypothetical protein
MVETVRERLHRTGKPPLQTIRALLQRVEVVGKDEARIQGSCEGLLKARASADELAETGPAKIGNVGC